MRRFEAGDVRRYYDRHTSTFLALGQGRRAGVIHRAVWGPGTTTRLDAFHYVDELIAGLLRPLLADRAFALHVVDLGCGVGASLCYLADRLPLRATGVTLSPVQARIAVERVREAGLSDRVRCVEGDYAALPAAVETADLAYAVESFVHGVSPERFFAECHRLVRRGGLLVICDDVLRSTTSETSSAATIDRFRRGWRINALLPGDDLLRLAHGAGFSCESVTDLTPWLELHRLRDRAIAVPAALLDAVNRAARPLLGAENALTGWTDDRFGHLLGGRALQTCLERGWIGYDFMVFRRG